MGEQEDKVDIFHPLAELHWEECCELPVGMYNAWCVSLLGKIYVGGGDTPPSQNPYKLFISSDLKSWDVFNTPTRYYALTTYHSQLVLIGGMRRNWDPTNKVWTTGAERIKWQLSLPPMKTSRYSSSAINTRCKQSLTECIVVSGGMEKHNTQLNTVEVFVQGEWSIVQSLPRKCSFIKCTIHDGILYLMGSENQQQNFVFYCKLDSLLSSLQSNDTLWKTSQVPCKHSSCVTFHHHLVSVGGTPSSSSSSSDIHAYSPLTRSWLYVGDLPIELDSASTVISTGELVVIGGRTYNSFSCKVFKASLKVSPFDLDSQFSMLALSKLEYAGVQIMASLKAIHNQLTAHIGISVATNCRDPEEHVKQAIIAWKSGRSHFPPTWKSLLSVLKKLNLEELSQQIKDYLLFGNQYLAAYNQILATHGSLDILYLNMLFVGPSRLGKTTARRRLTGEIIDIDSAGEPEQISTGVVETGHSIVVRNISHTTAVVMPSEWSATKDLTHEARILLQFFHLKNPSQISGINDQEVIDTNSNTPLEADQEVIDVDSNSPPQADIVADHNSPPQAEHSGNYYLTASRFLKSIKRNVVNFFRKHFGIRRRVTGTNLNMEEEERINDDKEVNTDLKENLVMTDNEIFDFFQDAVTTDWEEVKFLLENTALLNMSDTGGQPEFMDMLPALVIGPALYLLFCKLTQDLQSSYNVSYLSPSGESTTPVESTYTVEEVIFQALSAIACLKSERKEEGNNLFPDLMASPQSKAFIVATHKDLVSEEHITNFDAKLQKRIRATDFYREGLVQFSSDNRLILAIDNKRGGAEEVNILRKFFEEHMQKHYRKIKIPAAWLVLSLYLRKQEKRTVSIEDCFIWSQKLNMSTEETKLALWFLHHRAGTLMYFPNLPELQDTIVTDVQIIYDSVSNLIVNTFRFGKVEKAASEKFRETGQFSLEDIRRATADISGDYIPLFQLVKLLEHLNIIAIIKQPEPDPSQDSHAKSSKVVYFMPCVLQNALNKELLIFEEDGSNSLLPASLMIRYESGFVPLGLFPAAIANLVGNDSFTLIIKGIKKNRVQFRFGADRDKVTFISRPHYYEIHITRPAAAVTKTHEVCSAVREIIESAIKTVTSRMNYAFTVSYQLAFECPLGRDHLCVVDNRETSPHMMDCLYDLKDPQPVEMQCQHLVWFGKPMNDNVEISGLNPLYQSALWDENVTIESLQLINYLDHETGEHREIRILEDLAPYWKKIAELVGIPPYRIKSIAKQESDVDCLRDVIGEWLDNAPQMPHCKRYSEKWRGLYNLLKDGRQEKLAADLEASLNAKKCSICRNYDEEALHQSTSAFSHSTLPALRETHSTTTTRFISPPTMMDIICFPLQDSKVDLTKEVGTKYLQFGILLLEDQTGAHISALERELMKNAQDINYRVFQEWLHGKGRQPVSWETLISVLEDIGLNQLAKSIRDAIIITKLIN